MLHEQPKRSAGLRALAAVLLLILASVWLTGSPVGGQTEGPADRKVHRTYEGESNAGKFQEALDNALAKLDRDLHDGGVADALASWKLVDVTGKRGGFAGVRSIKVTISASRSPDWKK